MGLRPRPALGCHLYGPVDGRAVERRSAGHRVAFRWQGYAALGFLTLSIILLVWLPYRHQPGDAAGLLLLGAGVVVLSPSSGGIRGRGAVLGGALDGPQLAAVALVVVGGVVLLDRRRSGEG